MTPVCSELTNEELAVLAKDDEAALERLIVKNDRFVIFMASKYLNASGYRDLYPSGYEEDLAQICRQSIVRTVKNYDPSRGVKFLTYGAKIMRRAMRKELMKDEDFRNNEGGIFPEEEDPSSEKNDDGYTDPLDVIIKNSLSDDGYVLSEPDESDEEFRPEHLKDYYVHLPRYTEEETRKETEEIRTEIKEEKKEETEEEEEEKKGPYKSNKETEHSWQYPVFHKALHDMQMETMMRELFDEQFDEAHREYLIYRFGLKDLTPKTWKETAEHFNLRISYAKKIEKEALMALRDKLQIEHLL